MVGLRFTVGLVVGWFHVYWFCVYVWFVLGSVMVLVRLLRFVVGSLVWFTFVVGSAVGCCYVTVVPHTRSFGYRWFTFGPWLRVYRFTVLFLAGWLGSLRLPFAVVYVVHLRCCYRFLLFICCSLRLFVPVVCCSLGWLFTFVWIYQFCCFTRSLRLFTVLIAVHVVLDVCVCTLLPSCCCYVCC